MNTDPRLVSFKLVVVDKAYIVGCHHRAIFLCGQRHSGMQIIFLFRSPGALQFKIKTVAKQRDKFFQSHSGIGLSTRDQGHTNFARTAARQRDQTIAKLSQPGFLNVGNPLTLTLLVGFGDKLGQIRITDLIFYQQHQLSWAALAALIENQQIGTENRFNTGCLSRFVKLYRGKEIIKVGQSHRWHTQLGDFFRQRLYAHQPVDKGVFGVQPEMNKCC